jgi:hypothetical protein
MQEHEALVPIEQEEIPFHGHTITAVKLEDDRIAIIFNWVCEALQLDPQGQTQRIERTPSIASELIRVRTLNRSSDDCQKHSIQDKQTGEPRQSWIYLERAKHSVWGKHLQEYS